MYPCSIKPCSLDDCDAYGGDLLQSGFWGAFKAEYGWTPFCFTVDGRPLLTLERPLARGLSFVYVPRGPELAGVAEADRTTALAAVADGLRAQLPRRVAFIRFDPPWHFRETFAIRDDSDDALADTENASPARPRLTEPFRRAGMDVQPPDTVVLDILGRDDETLLSGMKPKWRYNIRLASKRGVSVVDEGSQALPEFYALYETTAARDRIAVHPQAYYEKLFALAQGRGPEAPAFRLWVARHEGTALAAIITVYYRGQAIYLYGASSDEKRNLMPAYALQWAAIRAAREAGCRLYDFYGIPPHDDPNHAMSGLYRFKTGFGGAIVRYPGSYDYPTRRPIYAAYRGAEAIRMFWHKKLKKKLGR